MGLLTRQDPIGIAGGLNLYGYANGDPVNFSDPFGLCPPEDANLTDCPGFFTAMGAVLGATAGGFGGGAGGLTLCAASGAGAALCAAGGASYGATKLGALGAAAGAALDAGIFAFSRRADAIEHAESLAPEIERHLDQMGGDPRNRGVRSQAGEVTGWLNDIRSQLRHMGRRTSREWERRLDGWQRRLDRIRDEGGMFR